MSALSVISGASALLSPIQARGRGAFAFHFAANPTDAEMAWLRRFRTIVTGDVLTPEVTAGLAGGGRRLIFYHWATGHYVEAHHTIWDGWRRRAAAMWGWLLSPANPMHGPDGRTPAHFYDPASADGNAAWAEQVARVGRSRGYDGVFLDLLGREHVPESAIQEFERRHPGRSFDAALGERLSVLRRRAPDLLLFGNQAYRGPDTLLRSVDWDLTESLITSYAWGRHIFVRIGTQGPEERTETFYRPWKELCPLLDGIEAVVRHHHPRLRLCHLNYVNPGLEPSGCVDGQIAYREVPDREAIFYGYAAARLWNHDSYCLCPQGHELAMDEIFHTDLGPPVAARIERDGVVVRQFERGFVTVNATGGEAPLHLDPALLPRGVRALWDCYAGTVTNLAPTLRPAVTAVSGKTEPSGRVFLYLR
jgi:hypothetical protein